MQDKVYLQSLLTNFTFSMLIGKISPQILSSLDRMGLKKPTEIQAKTLPYLLMGNDLIGAAKTGSGKTLAFLIPIVDLLLRQGCTAESGTSCIIVSPTRELALQTNKVLEKLVDGTKITSALVIGGVKKAAEAGILETGRSIVVGTPGRLLDHLISTKKFKYRNLQCLVLDEADKLLEAGFEQHMTGIIRRLPKKRQTILFSATINEKVKDLAKLAMTKEPVYITVSDTARSTVQGLKQGYFICPTELRIGWLFRILKKTRKQKVMVFFSSCRSVDFHCEFFLNHCKAPVMSIHGKQTQARRRATFEQFVSAQSGALFCTDVAARGLDIPAVHWIVQYDPPSDPKEYIHRVGRTARGLDGKGSAVLLLRPEEEPFLDFLAKERVAIDKYTFDEPSHQVQTMLEELVLSNGLFKTLARKALLSFLRCYRAHPMKNVFDIGKLDLDSAAKAFGFRIRPHVDLGKRKR